MEDPYKRTCLSLVGSISQALEQLERRNYGAAEEILRDAWDKAAQGKTAGERDAPLLLR